MVCKSGSYRSSESLQEIDAELEAKGKCRLVAPGRIRWAIRRAQTGQQYYVGWLVGQNVERRVGGRYLYPACSESA